MTENIFIILAVTGGVTLTCYFLASVVYSNLYSRTKNYLTRKSLQKIENSLLKFSYNELAEDTKEMLRKRGITDQESYDNPPRSINGITTIPEGYEFEGLRPVLEFDPTPERIKPMAAPFDHSLYPPDDKWNGGLVTFTKNGSHVEIPCAFGIIEMTRQEYSSDNYNSIFLQKEKELMESFDKPKKDTFNLKRKIDI